MRELADVVDFFVINEQPKTSFGMPKPLYFQMNKALFAEFNSKIIVVNETISDDLKNSWDEHAGRLLSLDLVKRIAPSDALIIFADVDEIPFCWTVYVLKHSPSLPPSAFMHLSMPYFYYSLCWKGQRPFSNAKAFLMSYLQGYARPPKDLFFDDKSQHYTLMDSGWHCSYCMSVVGVVISLWLNVFVGIIQSFQKIPSPFQFAEGAPPGGPVFGAVEMAVLVLFVIAGWCAVKRFHPITA